VDVGVVNELGEYLGDFERWQAQFLDGYENERERLQQEVDAARADVLEQERVCAKRDRLPELAADDDEMRDARCALIRDARANLERRVTRLRVAQTALADVLEEAPADAMLDFFNELGNAIRGRLMARTRSIASTSRCGISSRGSWWTSTPVPRTGPRRSTESW
jgi:hypothetical protein